jgi:hypothetical protein
MPDYGTAMLPLKFENSTEVCDDRFRVLMFLDGLRLKMSSKSIGGRRTVVV